jgi:hypothetical protein
MRYVKSVEYDLPAEEQNFRNTQCVNFHSNSLSHIHENLNAFLSEKRSAPRGQNNQMPLQRQRLCFNPKCYTTIHTACPIYIHYEFFSKNSFASLTFVAR